MNSRFSQEYLETIKAGLLQKKDKLLKSQSEAVDQDPFGDTERTLENAALDVEAQEQEGHARLEAIEDQVEESLKRIDEALERLKTSTWGICTSCGDEIDQRRLEIDATVHKCMNCHRHETATTI